MKSDDFLDDGDERDRSSTGAIFASGWFRAVLVLGVLAITLVVTVPYALRWMDPGQARIERQAGRPVDSRPAEPHPIEARQVEARPTVAPTPIPVPAPVSPAASAPARTTDPAPVPATVATPAPIGPAGPVTTPAHPPKPTAPAVASAPVTERLIPAPTPAPPTPVAERESKPARPSAADAGSGKVEPATRKAAAPESEPAKAVAGPASRGGDFWVQVGAFQHERNAEALVRSVRDKMKMPAQVSRAARAAEAPAVTPSRHEVFVSDAPVGAVNAALRGRGSAQAVRGGVAVQPPLELKEAVALSQRLSGEGMNVKIRRVGGSTGAPDPAIAYVVRVGGYGTRAQAEAARHELARKGLTGFVTPVAAHSAAK